MNEVAERIYEGDSAKDAVGYDGPTSITATVLETASEKSAGFREFEDPRESGRSLLFVHEDDSRMLRYTMEGVEFPLDMIFVRGGEVSATMQEVQPGTRKVVGIGSKVVETRPGWIEENGVEVGTSVEVDRSGDEATIRFGVDRDDVNEDRVDEQTAEIVDVVAQFTDVPVGQIREVVTAMARAGKSVGFSKVVTALKSLRSMGG